MAEENPQAENKRRFPAPDENSVDKAYNLINDLEEGEYMDDRQLRPMFRKLNIHQYLGVMEELERQGIVRRVPEMNQRGKVGYMKYAKVVS